MEDLDRIKTDISIIDLAEMFKAQPAIGSRGKFMNCKHNPLRSEKSCSLKLVPSTNTFSDFGGSGSSTIDFYQQATGKTLSESIKDLKDMLGIDNMPQVEAKKLAPMPEVEYMSSSVVRKVFEQQIELDFKDKTHKKLLDTIAPKTVFKQAKSEDVQYLTDIVRKDKHSDTLVVLLHDEHRVEKTMRYRNKMVGEDMKKWVALSGTQSNVLYTRLTEDPITYVVEGSHDILTCILLGLSVIALPSASYKGQISHEISKERTLIFIGDDNKVGQECISRIMAETVCDKKLFNYNEFREKYKLKGEDFSDLVFNYKDMSKFKEDMLEYVGGLDNQKGNDWLNTLKAKGKSVTREIIAQTENMKMLIDGMLPHGQITTFVGQPNVGKSAITFAIINRLMESKEIENVLYFDADNPLIYTKDRILKLMDKNGDDNITYYTGSTASKLDMLADLELLTNFRDSGKKTLVVIDSLKNFINGSINDDKSLNPMFDILQQVRDVFGATIIVLHHTRKGKDEDGKLNYVGSQVIEASSDNMTYLSRVEDSDTMIMENSKARALLTPKLAFDLDFNEMEFSEADLPKEVEDSDGIELMVSELENGFIDKSELKKRLKGKLSAKKIEIYLKDHKDTMFKYKKDGETWLVGLVEETAKREIKVVETVYEDIKAEDKEFNKQDLELF